ncbi:MAG: hypothetical protein LBS69_08525 [Prevotellaceae bacterium]|jgi:hypothetical protein|nr:hypothetical protein [Prevotellaceae bacterium]
MNKVFKTLIIACAGMTILLSGCKGPGNSGPGNSSPVNIVEPAPEAIETIEAIEAINVYIENSGSMDGYVNGVTEFEQTIYSYLTDIDISNITDNLNLFYINSKIIPFGSNVRDFIENLEPATFKQRGGNRGTSDIANVIDSVLSNTKKNTVSILITDGIFSPGKNIDADQYLVSQKTTIRGNVVKYLEHNANAAIIVYRLSSNFNGIYYNKIDARSNINEQRPYYIWVIGDAGQLNELRRKAPDSKFIGGGVKNVFSVSAGNRTVNYAVKQGSGEFKLDRQDPKKTILKWKKDSKGKTSGMAKFSVNANLSGFLLDNDCLLDESSYRLNDNDFDLNITPATGNQSGYTHSINLSTAILKKNFAVSVKLLIKIPQWIEDVNDDDGSEAVADKTYGIKYQIQGVYEAFTYKNDCYTEIKINIK